MISELRMAFAQAAANTFSAVSAVTESGYSRRFAAAIVWIGAEYAALILAFTRQNPIAGELWSIAGIGCGTIAIALIAQNGIDERILNLAVDRQAELFNMLAATAAPRTVVVRTGDSVRGAIRMAGDGSFQLPAVTARDGSPIAFSVAPLRSILDRPNWTFNRNDWRPIMDQTYTVLRDELVRLGYARKLRGNRSALTPRGAAWAASLLGEDPPDPAPAPTTARAGRSDQ